MDWEKIFFFFSAYNLIAFGGQCFAGWLLDKYPTWLKRLLQLAVVLLGMGTCEMFGIVVQTICLGVGNCIFHIAGGSFVLRQYKTFAELGIFVSRGFGGSTQASEYVLLFPCTFALGKALGGILCDKIGYKDTILSIFCLSFLALQFDGVFPLVVLTLAFNMTMPLTLRLAHWCNPAYPGMMFGLAAGCLLPGYFWKQAFFLPPQAMVVIQFLTLFVAGVLYLKFGRKLQAPLTAQADQGFQ